MSWKVGFVGALGMAFVAAGGPGSAHAAPPAPELRYEPALDLAVTGAGAVLWTSSELLKGQLAPSSCRLCDRHADGSDALNRWDAAARGALRWSSPGLADALSYGTGFVLAPLAAFGLDAMAAVHDGRGDELGVDALVILEAAVIAADLNQLVKFSAGRERPFVHALSPEQKARTSQPSDNNLSFFSGHTTWAFALAAASGTVASMREYRLAPLVWGAGMGFATATGYLRIAGDKHYLTDVIAGAVVGSGVGVALPLLFHSPRSESAPPVRVAASPQMVRAVVGGSF